MRSSPHVQEQLFRAELTEQCQAASGWNGWDVCAMLELLCTGELTTQASACRMRAPAHYVESSYHATAARSVPANVGRS